MLYIHAHYSIRIEIVSAFFLHCNSMRDFSLITSEIPLICAFFPMQPIKEPGFAVNSLAERHKVKVTAKFAALSTAVVIVCKTWSQMATIKQEIACFPQGFHTRSSLWISFSYAIETNFYTLCSVSISQKSSPAKNQLLKQTSYC